MTVEKFRVSDGKGDEHVLVMCSTHEVALRGMLAARGLQDSAPDPYEEVENSMTFGVATLMGPDVFVQYGGCPACVLEGTLERACDDISIQRRKSN